MSKIENKINKMKQKLEEVNRHNDKQLYNDSAKVIVGVKLIKHMVFKLPEAIKEKKNAVETKDSSKEKKSVFDYIEDPDFDYDEEVEKVSNNIEKKADKVNQFIANVGKVMSPLYWIKRIIDKIKNNDVKMLGKGNQLQENKSKSDDDRKKFVSELRSVSNISMNNQMVSSINRKKVKIDKER